jgi:cytochrome c-type biogenesis protein CcmE
VTDNSMTQSDLDLSPRPAPTRSTRAQRKWLPLLVLGLVVVAGGVILVKFLGSAVDYYCNVDEIGERDGCDAGRRLRVQGTVDEGSVEFEDGITTFSMSFGGVALPVRYRGEPGGIFAECEPVVVHGEVDDAGVLRGDDIEVKHSNEYEAENPDRVDGDQSACDDSAA